MPKPAAHIATANYTSITETYFKDVFLPAFWQVEGSPVIEKCYRVAGRSLRVRFFGYAIHERLSRALAHLEVASTETPDLTVSLWDSSGTATDFPSPWSDPAYHFDVGTDTRQTSADGFRGVYLGGEESLSFYDPTSKTAHFWTRDASLLPPWVSAAPIRTILHWFLSDADTHLLHGAVVGSGGKSVLLTAKGGSGKSTTALSCLLAGMDYLGDDYVAVGLGESVTAHGLYASAKVSPERVPAFDAVRPHVWANEGEKSILFLADLFPDRLVASVPLSAILIPVITNAERTEIIPASKTHVLLALLPTTLMQLPLARADAAARIGEIVSRTPCHFLRLGRDSHEAAAVIRRFLAIC